MDQRPAFTARRHREEGNPDGARRGGRGDNGRGGPSGQTGLVLGSLKTSGWTRPTAAIVRSQRPICLSFLNLLSFHLAHERGGGGANDTPH